MSWPDTQDDVGILRPGDFYRESHRRVYESILDLFAAGRDADVVAVFEHMREAGLDPDLSMLNAMASNAISKGSAKRHAEIIRERAVRRGVIALCSDVHDAALSGHTTDEVIELANVGLSSLNEGRSMREPQSVSDIVAVQVHEIDRRSMAFKEGRRLAMSTGIKRLDDILAGGYRPGELVIVAGRPAMGKTTLAMTTAYSAAERKEPALVCSQEMSNGQQGDRLISMASNIPLSSIRTGNLQEHEWPRLTQAMERYAALPLYIDDQPALRMDEVRAKARKIKRRHGLTALVVDYLQLMQGVGDNRTQEIGSLSRGLKHLAVELGVVVIALSQLNRAVEQRMSKRPMMADLRESGDIEADADIIIMLYRDEIYNPDTADRGIAEIIVTKQRNGPTGTVLARFEGDCTRFSDLDDGVALAPRAAPDARKGSSFGSWADE